MRNKNEVLINNSSYRRQIIETATEMKLERIIINYNSL